MRQALIRVTVGSMILALMLSGCQMVAGWFGADEPEDEQYTDNPWTEGQNLSGSTVAVFGPFLNEDASHFEDSMDSFETQTGITVDYEGSGDFESQIVTRAESGNAPDIAAFPQPGLMHELIDDAYIADVSQIISDEDLDKAYDQSRRDMAQHGGIEGGVWYRATLKSLVWYPHPEFGDEGYTVPETWDELITLSNQMVDDGETPWSIGMESGGATGWVATDWMEDIMLRTVTPEKYDQWVAGDLAFDAPEVRRAAGLMEDIWFNSDYVLGGTNSIVTTPFGDTNGSLEEKPPTAWLHKQASFISGFFGEGVEIGTDMRYFYFPPIDPEEGSPVLVAGDIMSPFNDDPATAALIRYFATGESIKAWVETGTAVSPHKDAKLDWYPDEWSRGYAEIVQNADTVRFDGSDLMPGAIGTGAFWTEMTDWIEGTDTLEEALQAIDAAWPTE